MSKELLLTFSLAITFIMLVPLIILTATPLEYPVFEEGYTKILDCEPNIIKECYYVIKGCNDNKLYFESNNETQCEYYNNTGGQYECAIYGEIDCEFNGPMLIGYNITNTNFNNKIYDVGKKLYLNDILGIHVMATIILIPFISLAFGFGLVFLCYAIYFKYKKDGDLQKQSDKNDIDMDENIV